MRMRWTLLALVLPQTATGDSGACLERARNFTLTAEPPSWQCARKKTLLLIRHAQGTHNLAELEEEASPTHHLREEHAALHAVHGAAWVLLHEATGHLYRDPALTAEGERQAAILHALMAETKVDAVALSPMRRTLQTAHLGIPQLRLGAHDARPRVIATELLRERIGPYMCDLRLAASLLKEEYGHVDFSEVVEEDMLFAEGQEYGPDEASKLAERAVRAAEWLLAQPDEHERIAVVSHQHFLLALTKRFGLGRAKSAGDESAVKREEKAASEHGINFRNAELQTAHLCERL